MALILECMSVGSARSFVSHAGALAVRGASAAAGLPLSVLRESFVSGSSARMLCASALVEGGACAIVTVLSARRALRTGCGMPLVLVDRKLKLASRGCGTSFDTGAAAALLVAACNSAAFACSNALVAPEPSATALDKNCSAWEGVCACTRTAVRHPHTSTRCTTGARPMYACCSVSERGARPPRVGATAYLPRSLQLVRGCTRHKLLRIAAHSIQDITANARTVIIRIRGRR